METTHRTIQLSTLREKAEAKSAQLIRCALKARSINNVGAQAHFLVRAVRLQAIAAHAARRLA